MNNFSLSKIHKLWSYDLTLFGKHHEISIRPIGNIDTDKGREMYSLVTAETLTRRTVSQVFSTLPKKYPDIPLEWEQHNCRVLATAEHGVYVVTTFFHLRSLE